MDRFLRGRPYYGLVKTWTADEEGLARMRQELELVFIVPGQFKPMSPVSNPPELNSHRRKHPRLRYVRSLRRSQCLTRYWPRSTGIAAVEDAARRLATLPRPGREAMGQGSLYRLVSQEQLLEIWMRHGAEIGFDELLKDELGGEELRALKEVFFQFLYRLEIGGRMRG